MQGWPLDDDIYASVSYKWAQFMVRLKDYLGDNHEMASLLPIPQKYNQTRLAAHQHLDPQPGEREQPRIRSPAARLLPARAAHRSGGSLPPPESAGATTRRAAASTRTAQPGERHHPHPPAGRQYAPHLRQRRGDLLSIQQFDGER